MDTLTQITLGAAVGEAILGKKAGNKAPAIGALFGIVPDLDVLANPFVNEVQALAIHRGISHSLLFSVVAAPVFGWLLYRLFKKETVPWKDWSLLVFWVIITHIFIDACTNYGTQVFQPFSDYPLSFNTIFIIDPFYTFPLMAGLLGALLLRRHPEKRRWANYLGLGISSLYLFSGFLIKNHVNNVFEEGFQKESISVDEYISTPMPLTQFLWAAFARSGDTVHVGLYSVFDENRMLTFHQVERNSELIKAYRDDPAVERILWFSRGYFTAVKKEDELHMYDLRFGRSDLWLSSEPAPFVWGYRLKFNSDSTRTIGFSRPEPGFDFSSKRFQKLIDRISGLE